MNHESMTEPQTRTIAAEMDIEGVGIHSGVDCNVRLFPADAGTGIAFRRPGGPCLPANVSTANADESIRRTVILGEGGLRFEQIEHLMAALAAFGVTDVIVEQQGPEVPFCDGGSRVFMERLRANGFRDTGAPAPVLEITRPIALEADGALMVATPHSGLRLSSFVEFPDTVVGNAGFTIEIDADTFEKEVAPARTFALARDIDALRQMGLIKGGNLQNAVVFDEQQYHNEALNFPNEVVRHKIIDLLGDLALLGTHLRGHFWGWRSGHRSHVLFAQKIAQEFLASR